MVQKKIYNFARTYSYNLENSASTHGDQVKAYDTESGSMLIVYYSILIINEFTLWEPL